VTRLSLSVTVHFVVGNADKVIEGQVRKPSLGDLGGPQAVAMPLLSCVLQSGSASPVVEIGQPYPSRPGDVQVWAGERVQAVGDSDQKRGCARTQDRGEHWPHPLSVIVALCGHLRCCNFGFAGFLTSFPASVLLDLTV
jgi:hypothetical protein